MNFGLKEKLVEDCRGIFRQYPQLESVTIYGSRAKGNYRNGSDVDITLKGKELTLTEQFSISNQIDDLMSPYTFDISIFHQISNPDLIDHIERVGQVFYQKSDHTS